MGGSKDNFVDEDIPTPAEIRVTVEGEMQLCREALEIRLKEYESMIVAYEKGDVDFEGFCDLHSKHVDKWGDHGPRNVHKEAVPSKPRDEAKTKSPHRGSRDTGHRSR